MSDDESVVEEEYLVYAELCDNADPNIFKHAESSFSSFALDSDQPLLIIGGQAFVGTYKDTVGTAVFLEEAPPGSVEQIGIGNEPSDPLFVNSPLKKLQYVAHTRKTLEMSRVLLLEKNKQCEEAEKKEEEKEYLEEDFAELDDNVDLQNDEMKDAREHKENVNETKASLDPKIIMTDEVEIVEGSNLGSSDTGKITLVADSSPLVMEERQVIENIEQMKITSKVNISMI